VKTSKTKKKKKKKACLEIGVCGKMLVGAGTAGALP